MQEALGAFGLATRQFPALLLSLAPWLVLTVALALWPVLLPGALDAVAAIWGPVVTPLIIPGPLMSFQMLAPLWLPQLVAFCGLAVAWQRRLLLQGRRQRGFLSAWAIVSGQMLLFVLVMFLIVTVVGLSVQGFVPPALQRQAGVGLLALTMAAGLIAAGRLCPVIAAAAIGDRRMNVRRAWSATRKRSGNLGLGLLLTWLPSALVLIVLFSANATLGIISASALRVLVWLLAVALSATFAALAYTRIAGRYGT